MRFIPGGPERYDHQKRGLLKLIQTGGRTALLFDPGTGKTATTIDYLCVLALKSADREARVLVVAPNAAIDTWVLQAEKWVSPQVNVWAEALGGSIKERAEALAARGNQPFRGAKQSKREHPRAQHTGKAMAWYARADDRERPITQSEGPDGLGDERPRLIIEAINFDTLSSRRAVGSGTMADAVLQGVKRFRPDIVVIDEMHKIKSATSNVSRLMSRIADAVPRVVGLTGTVMPAGPMDVFGQWRAIDPYAFGDLLPDGSRGRATFGGFRERYGVIGGYMGREVIAFKNLDQMQEIMSQRASVVRKEDALDLPPTTPVIVPVHLSPREQKAYDEMKKQLVAQLSSTTTASAANKLAMMMKLRQITSGHVPEDGGGVVEVGDSKAEVIRSIANDTLAGEKRIVVFAVFTHEIRVLARKLATPDTIVMVINGGVAKDERIRLRMRFGSDEPTRMILIAQIKTISLAVNELVTASHAIYGSLSMQRDDQIQSQDRLNRIGQTRPVTFWFAVAPGTVDEVIMRTNEKRTSLEAAMLHHIHGEPDPLDGDDRGDD